MSKTFLNFCNTKTLSKTILMLYRKLIVLFGYNMENFGVGLHVCVYAKGKIKYRINVLIVL
jgi:hypothetical protein